MVSHPSSSAQAPKLPFPEILRTSEGTVRILQNLGTVRLLLRSPAFRIPQSGPEQKICGLLTNWLSGCWWILIRSKKRKKKNPGGLRESGGFWSQTAEGIGPAPTAKVMQIPAPDVDET